MASAIYASARNRNEAKRVADALNDVHEDNAADIRILEQVPGESTLPAGETDLTHGLLQGALWGAIGGLLTGLVLAATLGGPLTMMIALGAGVGLAYGLLGGALAGMTTRHRSFEWLSRRGKRASVILRVDIHDQSARERVLHELKQRDMYAVEPSINSSYEPATS